MKRTATLLITAIALMVLAPMAAAQRPGKDKAKDNGGSTVTVTASFSALELHLIRTYFGEHPQEVQPLPPGIAKNLARGKPLPPGIAKKRLPASLASQLPVRDGVEVTIFGDRIVLLEASGLIVDILDGVF